MATFRYSYVTHVVRYNGGPCKICHPLPALLITPATRSDAYGSPVEIFGANKAMRQERYHVCEDDIGNEIHYCTWSSLDHRFDSPSDKHKFLIPI